MISDGSGVLLAALIAFFAGAPLALYGRRISYGATLLGAILLLVAAATTLMGWWSGASLTWPSPLGGTESLGLDGLSAYFALIASVVWLATSSFSLVYDTDYSRLLAAMYALTVGSIALLLSSQDSILFLIGWEGMTLASFGMILQAHGRPSRIFSAGFIFLAFGEASTLFIFLALAGLHVLTGSFAFSAVSGSGLFVDGIFLAALIGFGLKMGVAPFHMSEWLPIAHSSAPSNASAVLSATLTLAGIYGLFRVVMLLGGGPAWWGALMIAIGAISALLGALFASVSEHTKGLPAYSTIENNGLAIVALGVALTARAEGLPGLFAFALFAAFFQIFAHSIAKAGLFLVAGYVDRTTGTYDMNAIGGRAKDPEGPAFPGALVCAMSLAAAPPTAGFVSEWMVLESLFQSYQFTADPLLVFIGLLAGAAVALAAGLILVAMVKVLSFGQLWRPDATRPAVRSRRLGGAILGIAGVVLGLGIGAPWVLDLAAIPASTFAGAALSAPLSTPSSIPAMLGIPAGWTIMSSAGPFGVLSPPVVPIAIALGMLVGVGYLVLGGKLVFRRADPWMAGNPVKAPEETYSAFGYSTGLRVMLKSLFLTREVRAKLGPVTLATIEAPESYDVELEVLDVFKIFYDDLRKSVLWVSEVLKRLIMPGRVGQYIAYLLVAAIVVILYVVLVF